MTPPREVMSNGLSHRVLTWGQDAAESTASPGRAPRDPVFLIHGFMDAAGTWDRVAPALAAAGHRVFAPDMRGFGVGARVPAGGYYHFPDYIADLAGLVDALVPDPAQPIKLVGHSMGGTVVTLYAGAMPERVSGLVSIEGLGPPDNGFEMGPLRMRRWLDDLRSLRAAVPMKREDARRRLGLAHPGVAPEILDTRLPHLVRDAGEGMVTWLYDPLHRTTSPMPFFARLFVEYARKVACPTLFVSGGPTGFHPPDEKERLAAFAHLESVELADAGHMVHWTRPDELARLLVDRLR